MRVILFGATGMIGQGVLRECLLDKDVERVLAVGRQRTGKQHEKLHELVHADLMDLAEIEPDLVGYDACLFCLGVSSAGMKEAEYRHITFDFTLSVARTLARLNPQMTFEYISGAGTDTTEKGRSMWARVKGQTENALLELPFKAVYNLRPGYIQPRHGIASKTSLYRALYAVFSPLYPVASALAPSFVTNTEELAKAMLRIAKHGAPKSILEMKDLHALAASQ
jgi:uncharacterized protein YbjT (DUF2867 family)